MATSKTVPFIPPPGPLSSEFRAFLACLLAKKFREQFTAPQNTPTEDSDVDE